MKYYFIAAIFGEDLSADEHARDGMVLSAIFIEAILDVALDVLYL